MGIHGSIYTLYSDINTQLNLNIAGGEDSVAQTFTIYNTLRKTNEETDSDSKFLNITDSKRQNISQVVFQNGDDDKVVDDSTVFDVSAMQDESIIAWVSDSVVYVASDTIINSNCDSSYLFSYIGYSSRRCNYNKRFR